MGINTTNGLGFIMLAVSHMARADIARGELKGNDAQTRTIHTKEDVKLTCIIDFSFDVS